MADNHYDAIVVGSGISGGWAAKELTEKGLKVLMLERGRNIEHVKDYVNAMKEAWDFPHRNRPTQAMKADFPVLMRDYGLAENLEGMWANEQDSPYIETQRFDWFRGYHVGGRSLLWGRQSYRFSDLDFEANLKDGIAADWPIRYADIAPWTGRVAGRRVPAADSLEHRREGCGRADQDGLRRNAPYDPLAHRQHHQAAARAGARQLPVPQQVHPGLSLRCLFLDPGGDATGGDEDRQSDVAAVLDRQGSAL
ncbi:hypothetical protein G6F65_013268 [Rhizopus arrhizus]|nr:hypothetical protein G6F65_013268 [Rhizopus arrhizus]